MYQPLDKINYQSLLIRMALAAGVGGFGALQLHGSTKDAFYAAGVAASMAGEAYLRVPQSPRPPDSPPTKDANE